MKKLLFVINRMNIGGPQKSLLALLDALDYTRFSADVMVLRPGGELEPYLNPNAKLLFAPALVTATTLPAGRVKGSLLTMLRSGKAGQALRSIAAMIQSKAQNTNMNQQRQALWKRYSPGLPRLAGEYDAAFGILGLSTYYVADLVNAKNKYHWIRSDTRILNRDTGIDGAYYKGLDGALSVSQECASIFEEMYPFTKGKVSVFHNLIPMAFYDRLPPEQDSRFVPGEDATLLTVTRLDPLKGIELAIEACGLLKKSGMKLKWYVLGDGAHRAAVEELIERFGVQDEFVLLGFKLNVPFYIRGVDLLVHASRSEGKSNAVDEALLMGVPVVATAYPTVADQVLHEVNGLVCTMSAEGIAAAVERLLDYPQLQQRLAGHKGNPPQDPNNFFENLLQGIESVGS